MFLMQVTRSVRMSYSKTLLFIYPTATATRTVVADARSAISHSTGVTSNAQCCLLVLVGPAPRAQKRPHSAWTRRREITANPDKPQSVQSG